MSDSSNSKDADRPDDRSPKTLAGFLASALEMEEKLSNSVYRDYLDPANWPADLKPNVFQKITKHLSVLIQDTKKHKKILSALTKQYGNDAKSR